MDNVLAGMKEKKETKETAEEQGNMVKSSSGSLLKEKEFEGDDNYYGHLLIKKTEMGAKSEGLGSLLGGVP